MDVVYPFFCGAVMGIWLCFFSILPRIEDQALFSFRKPKSNFPVQAINPQSGDSRQAALTPASTPMFPVPAFPLPARERKDAILDTYRDEAYQEWVTVFFTGVLKPSGFFDAAASAEAASAILTNASAFDISPSLAFALCWVESRFNPVAVNKKNRDGSIDRGLFQLNSYSFPKLKDADFFNPSINTYYGMAHLRWCLDAGGSVVTGLAMYNAGTGRVNAEGAPKRTLNYISDILEFQRRIEDTFAAHTLPVPAAEEAAVEPTDEGETNKAEPYFEKPRLALLTPATGRRP
jgi:soluble lytic murein transglycosylase-like protein